MKNRLAHTYLFTGGDETEKKNVTFDFAKALNCEAGQMFSGCECLSCRKVENGNHPDVRVLGRDEKAKSIKIEEVREAVEAASLKPYEGKWKVFILIGAERLTPDAANALLKTLEEPPAHTLFILLTGHKANLLETIQSRSFEVRWGAAAEKAVEKSWEDSAPPWGNSFEDYQAASRDEVKGMLDSLMFYFRSRRHAEAFDYVYEAKDALEANANQKLSLTRLAMRLQKLNPS